MTWHAKETVRGCYDRDPEEAEAFLDELIDDMADDSMPIEVRSLGRTLRTWRDQILAWHRARVTNGPTESINNLIKRIKRISASGSVTSTTIGPGSCSTPASPTAASSPPSPRLHPREIRLSAMKCGGG